MTPHRIAQFRRALVTLCVLATVWVTSLVLTGGFVIHLFGLSISSRNPRNPALLALISGIAAWALPMQDRRRQTRDRLLRWRDRGMRLSAQWPWWADAASVTALFGSFLLVRTWASARPLWLDEEMIALNARDRSFADLAGRLWLDQAAPLGWLALTRSAIVTFGTGEAAVRAVPLVFGIATLVVAAWAGRRWLTPIAAALFVLLCAVSPWLAHYPLELKHYSADAFWALLLPMLAVWVTASGDALQQLRRARIWWLLAAVAHWFSNGGLLVVPACAILLVTELWRTVRYRAVRWRAVLEMVAGGLVALASLALHFVLSIRYVLGNDYFRRYWEGGLPPEGLGLAGIAVWLGERLQPLAENPVGTEHWVVFWTVAVLGCVVAPQRYLRVILPIVPLSAFVFGALAVVPLLERVALWIVPVLYFAVASVLDRALRIAREAFPRRSYARLIIAVTMAAFAVVVCADVIARGWDGVESRRVSDRNHGLNDRAAVEWLMDERQPGDAIVTTHMGLPAVWWYGGIDLSQGEPPGSGQPHVNPVIEATFIPDTTCTAESALRALPSARRLLVYIGFPDAPAGFNVLLVKKLAQAGAITADRTFAEASRVVVIDLSTAAESSGDGAGCVALRQASRW